MRKQLNNINVQLGVDINEKLDANNNTFTESIDFKLGFNYAECGGQDTHIGVFNITITDPSNGTFDLNSLAMMIKGLQKDPTQKNGLVLQMTMPKASSQNLDTIKALLETLTIPQECQQTQPHPASEELEALGAAWGTVPANEAEGNLASSDLNAFLVLKLQPKTDQEVYDLYAVICSILSNHNCLPAGHPKLVADFADRAEVIADIVSLITPIVAN